MLQMEMINGVLIAIALFLVWITLEAINLLVAQDQQNKSIHVRLAMTTSIKMQIPFLVNTTSTRWRKEWNVIEKNGCSCSCPTLKLASHAMATKMSWTTSWVLCTHCHGHNIKGGNL
jgi:hypothetical protein